MLPSPPPPRVALRIYGAMLGMVVAAAAIGGAVGALLTHVLPNVLGLLIGVAIVIWGFRATFRWGKKRLLDNMRGTSR